MSYVLVPRYSVINCRYVLAQTIKLFKNAHIRRSITYQTANGKNICNSCILNCFIRVCESLFRTNNTFNLFIIVKKRTIHRKWSYSHQTSV
ncbi:hypothetical protein FR483_n171L [Paramecium bursaria Chlorella virus FR483]|uniref:Uncharacterized protein n171L n=1 Tax=Paramecium bursaria Chlorella virus FR483 TaxID=399781 RepID=A7J6M5_PBCVF|nr:hypothetical protein FR483_n171L [Paramecium bursaria Chlorella virus FR483]ABT15456.1 hypothetical protein FR483_n171L [Paramecium bursaria Chlorella virus FR483]